LQARFRETPRSRRKNSRIANLKSEDTTLGLENSFQSEAMQMSINDRALEIVYAVLEEPTIDFRDLPLSIGGRHDNPANEIIAGKIVEALRTANLLPQNLGAGEFHKQAY
jgi:hypothetical protein